MPAILKRQGRMTSTRWPSAPISPGIRSARARQAKYSASLFAPCLSDPLIPKDQARARLNYCFDVIAKGMLRSLPMKNIGKTSAIGASVNGKMRCL